LLLPIPLKQINKSPVSHLQHVTVQLLVVIHNLDGETLIWVFVNVIFRYV